MVRLRLAPVLHGDGGDGECVGEERVDGAGFDAVGKGREGGDHRAHEEVDARVLLARALEAAELRVVLQLRRPLFEDAEVGRGV